MRAFLIAGGKSQCHRWSTTPCRIYAAPIQVERIHHRVFSSTNSRKDALLPATTTNNKEDDDESYAQDAAVYDSYVSSVQSTARSVQSSLFSYTSGRAQRRRAQRERRRRWLERRRRQKPQDEHVADPLSSVTEAPAHDTRTISDLIFPNPFQHQNVPQPRPWPSTVSQWRVILSGAWQDYMWTWRGFWAKPGFIVQDPLDEENEEKSDTTEQFSIEDNVKKNAAFLKEEALNVKTQVQDATGIHTMADAKAWAARGLQLATECVKEFMQGYRKGRDEEVENMLTKYFQEFQTIVGISEEKQENEADGGNTPKRRRKIRSRVRNRFHASLLHRHRYGT